MQLVRSTRASSITNFVPISRPFSKLTTEPPLFCPIPQEENTTPRPVERLVFKTRLISGCFFALSQPGVSSWFWIPGTAAVADDDGAIHKECWLSEANWTTTKKKWCGPYLHESLRTAGKISAAGQAGIARVQVRIDEALVEAAHREPVEDDLWKGEGEKQEM